MNRRLSTLVVGAVACVFVITGCSIGDGAKTRAADAKAVHTNHVDMPESYKFSPVAAQVKVGESITWTNNDNFTHDVTFTSGDNTKHHTVKPGDSVKIKMDKKGTWDYECRFHSQNMRGKVVVV